MKREYRLAPMSGDIRLGTVLLLVLPAALAVAAAAGVITVLPAVVLVLVYALVWLWWRPTAFRVTGEAVEIAWPLRRAKIPRARIRSARVVGGAQLKKELGWCTRIGAGGLWGGFGLLWTRNRGLAHMYISRTRDLVWLECGPERPWLISPADPHDFARALFPGTPGPPPGGRGAP